MKHPFLVLAVGLVAAVAGFAACFFLPQTSHRALLHSPQPELAWLKREFQIGEPEFARITALHEAYLPQCAEMCRRIDARKAELREVLSHTHYHTPAMDTLLADIARLRLECHQNMLRHFLEVSRAMPEAQGRRYLDWVQGQTLLGEEAMAQHHRHH